MSQFVISQQDNYDGLSNQCSQFLLDLYDKFSDEKFIYIYHDKESDLHLHLILITSLDKTKKDILEIFPNADVQYQRANNKNAFKYLTHSTKKCIRENKTPYDEKNIQFHNITDKWLNEWLEKERFEKNELSDEREILDSIVDDILTGCISTYNQCLKKYKGVALKYSRAIKETLELM